MSAALACVTAPVKPTIPEVTKDLNKHITIAFMLLFVVYTSSQRGSIPLLI